MRLRVLLIILFFSLDRFYPALEAGEIKAGMILIFRYQGPKGAPGMPEVGLPCSLFKKFNLTERSCTRC